MSDQKYFAKKIRKSWKSQKKFIVVDVGILQELHVIPARFAVLW